MPIHPNTRRAFFERNREFISELVELEDQGFNVRDALYVTTELYSRCKKGGLNFDVLMDLIMNYRGAENADNGRFHVAE